MDELHTFDDSEEEQQEGQEEDELAEGEWEEKSFSWGVEEETL